MEYAGEISAGLRQTDNKACANRIGDVDKYDGDRAGRPEQCTSNLGGMRQYHFGLLGNQLLGKFGRPGAARRETNLDAEIAPLRPSKFLNVLFESCQPLDGLGIAFSEAHKDCYVPHSFGLLCMSRKWHRHRTAEQTDDLTPPHRPPEAWTQHYRLNLGDWKRHDVRYGLKADLCYLCPLVARLHSTTSVAATSKV